MYKYFLINNLILRTILYSRVPNGQVEIFCTTDVPEINGYLGGASLSIFLHGSQGRAALMYPAKVVGG